MMINDFNQLMAMLDKCEIHIYAGAAGGKRGECKNYDDGPCCFCRALAFLEPR